MNRQDQAHLLGERNTLQRMIAETPEEEVLDRGSLTARLEEVEHLLAEVNINEREPARAQLTFNGRPVVGSYGIFADFGMKAVSGFTEAVAAVAATLAGPLFSKGLIPNRDQNQLLITNTALGSFGFELEEYRTGKLPFEEQSMLELALERTQNLLQGTINADDELLADAATELDQRALDKVRAFVKTLADNDAVCALQFRNHSFRFSDMGQVRRSLERLSQDNLREEEQYLEGVFEGVLPKKRRAFEFKLKGRDEIIVGKVSPDVTSLDEINTHLYEATRIKVMTTRVGNGQPRYVLLELPQWADSQN